MPDFPIEILTSLQPSFEVRYIPVTRLAHPQAGVTQVSPRIENLRHTWDMAHPPDD